MDCDLGKVTDRSYCRLTVGNTRVNDIAYADDAVFLTEWLGVLVMVPEVIHKDLKPFWT